MRISIVTISYNQAQFLRDCIESVLGQDHQDVEYIAVDAGSTDGSREIIESYGERIIKVFEADDGPADGLNKGFSLATGEVLGFLNSDDKLLPGALTCVARSFDSKRHVDVITGCGYFIDANGRVRRRVIPSRFTPWLYAHGAVTVFQQGTFFRSSTFHAVNGFNAQNRIAWDGELLSDMALSGARFARICDDLAVFRIHNGSITGGGGHTNANEEFKLYRERIFHKVTGRDKGGSDWFLDNVARVVKHAADPSYLFWRLGATFDWCRRARRGAHGNREAQ